jgi:hypothetical protein
VPAQAAAGYDEATARGPVLKPALRRVWRDRSTLQLGVSARHAVVLTGLSKAEAAFLDGLDGTRTPADLATACGLADADATRLLETLAAAGALDDAEPPGWQGEDVRQRLLPDRLALSLHHPAPGGADRALRARAAARVTTYGAGRVGAAVARLLAAAGVGGVECIDDRALRRADVSPAGQSEAVPATRGAAVTALLGAAAPSAGRRRPPAAPPDLVVIAPVTSVPPPEVVAAVRAVPHVCVVVRETTAIVGPFVLPGTTPCLRCVELGRGDRDPAWPALAAQLVSAHRLVEPCDVSLATLAASLTVLHALSWLDTATPPASAGGTLEIDMTGAQLRRRSVEAHPACGCGAAG